VTGDFDVGGRIREIRHQFNISQRQLAENAGVPHGKDSLEGSYRSSPSVAFLRNIIGGFGMTMSEFFELDASPPSQVLFKPADLRDLTSSLYQGNAAAQQKTTPPQVGDTKAHGLQILQERNEADADTGDAMIEHEANEGGIVISGEIEITVGNVTSVLNAGDAYLFNSPEPRRFRTVSAQDTEIISACTPPNL